MDTGSRILSMCAIVLIAVGLSIPVAAVLGAVGDVEAKKPTILRIGFMQAVDSLNPNVGLNDAAYVYYGLVYDALHGVDNNFGTEANLATDWRVVDNETDSYMIENSLPWGSVWEFDIAQNITWHDDEPLTVDDVVWTFNLQCDPVNYDIMWAYQPYAYFMKYAWAVGEDKVRVQFYDRETGIPTPASYARLVCIPILPKHKLGTESATFIGFNWTGVFSDGGPTTVGTGPFTGTERIYQEWLDGDYLTLDKNPNYHALNGVPKVVQFDQVMMYFYDEATAMRLALERGELDVAQFPPHEYNTIKEDVLAGKLKNVTTFNGLKCTNYWTEVAINMNVGGPNPSRIDPAIRHALAMATNKQYIIDNFYLGYAEEGNTLISPAIPYWHYEPTEAEKWKFDLAAANDLLDAAGYVDTNGDDYRECTEFSYAVIDLGLPEGTPLTYDMLVRREYPEEKDIANYLKQEWANIGINLIIKIVNEAELSKTAYTYLYDMLIWYWSADPDPNYQLFVQSKASWAGWSDNMYYNPAYEENYTKSIQEFDPAKRKVYTDNCQKVHYQDQGYIILAYVDQTYAWRDDYFGGWGDWAAQPTRSVDAFWTGNPLFFDLFPIKERSPGPPVLLIGIGAGVAVAAVVAFVLLRKRGGGKKKDMGESPLGD